MSKTYEANETTHELFLTSGRLTTKIQNNYNPIIHYETVIKSKGKQNTTVHYSNHGVDKFKN
ncbi:unnamed protein product [Acanthoscelides obtectus]|uniref:Uncharacterized protein n=1 Tax=Acanthoscelides obtectus TaxID=200917 RepID=A0A9P0KXX4_ACAOB|nr:unnamed protein product [Acanthoscelides obtectus]CAK1626254.1 hypothetical protein AOBTE_LOCUS3719 [Acanthoscelides obtectus]